MRGLGGEPGIKVRRWIGRTMTDEELIDYALERLEGKTGADRDAEFKTVICMVLLDEKGDIIAEKSAAGALKGHILKAADPVRIKGFPFESLFFADEYGMLLGNLHRMSDDEKRGNAFNNHRERALEEAVLVIKKWMA